MLARTLLHSLIAAVAAVVVVVAGVWFVAWDRGPLTGFDRAEQRPLLPELQDNIAAVERLTIRQVNRKLVFERQGDGWGLARREGYPARAGDVNDLLQRLAKLNVHYVSTRPDPAYREYVLRGPEDGGNATVFEFAGDGKLPPRLHIGQPVSLANAPQQTFTAARRMDQEAIAIVKGKLRIDVDFRRWIDQDILELPRSRVYTATKKGPNQRFVFTRTDAESFSVDAGGDFESLNERERANATGGLAPLRFVDVRGAQALELNRQTEWQARYRSLDGLVVKLTFWKDANRKLWAKVDATTASPLAREGDNYVERGEPAEGIADRAQAIEARTDGWVYRLSDSALQQILAPLPVVALAPED